MASGGLSPTAVEGESSSLFDLCDNKWSREKLPCLSESSDEFLNTIKNSLSRSKSRRKSERSEKKATRNKQASTSRSLTCYTEGDENEYGGRSKKATDNSESGNKTSRGREDFASGAGYYCEYDICSKFSINSTCGKETNDRMTRRTVDWPGHRRNGGKSHKRAKRATEKMLGKEAYELQIQQNGDMTGFAAGACRAQWREKGRGRQQAGQELYYGSCMDNYQKMSPRPPNPQPKPAKGRVEGKYPYNSESCDDLSYRYSAGSLASSMTASLGSKPSMVQLKRLKRGKPRYIKRPINPPPPRANPKPHICQCSVPLQAECGKMYNHIHECKCKTKTAASRPDHQMISMQRPKTGIAPKRGYQDDIYFLPMPFENSCDVMPETRDLISNPSTLSCYIKRKQVQTAWSCHCCTCLMNVKGNEITADVNLGMSDREQHKGSRLRRGLELPHLLPIISCSPYKPDRQTNSCVCPICGLKYLLRKGANNLKPRNSNRYAPSPSQTSVPNCQSRHSPKPSCTCDQCMLKRGMSQYSYASSKKSSACTDLEDQPNMETNSSCVYFERFESAKPRILSSVWQKSRFSARDSPPLPKNSKGPMGGRCTCCKCQWNANGQERSPPHVYDTDEMSELCRCKTPVYSLLGKPSRQSQALQMRASVSTIYSSRSLVVFAGKPTKCCCGKKCAAGNISIAPYSEPVRVEQAMPVIPLRTASEASSWLCVKCKCVERPLTIQPDSPAKSSCICKLKDPDGVCTCCPVIPKQPILQPVEGTCICPTCKCKYSPTSVEVPKPHPVACLCAECICPDELDVYSHQFTASGQVFRPPSANSFVSQTISKCPCPDCPKYVAKQGGHHVSRGHCDLAESRRSMRSVESWGSGRSRRSSQSRHSGQSKRSDRSRKSNQKQINREKESSNTARRSRKERETLRSSRKSDSCPCSKVCPCESELSEDDVARKSKTSESKRPMSGYKDDFAKYERSGEGAKDQQSRESKSPSKVPSSITTIKITRPYELGKKEQVGTPPKTSLGAAPGQQDFKKDGKIEEVLMDEDKYADKKTLSKISSQVVSGPGEHFARVGKALTQIKEAKTSPSTSLLLVSEDNLELIKFHDSEANLNAAKTPSKIHSRVESSHEEDEVKFYKSGMRIQEKRASSVISARQQGFAKPDKSDEAFKGKETIGVAIGEKHEEMASLKKDESDKNRILSKQDGLSRSDVTLHDEVKDLLSKYATDKERDVEVKIEIKQSDVEVDEQSGIEAEKSPKDEECKSPGIANDNESKSMDVAQSKNVEKDSVSKGSSSSQREKLAKVCAEKKDSSFDSKCSCAQYEGMSISKREPCVCSLCFHGTEFEGSRISNSCSCFSQTATCKHSSNLSSIIVCSSSRSGSSEGAESLVELPISKKQLALSEECTDESKNEYMTAEVPPEELFQVAAEPKAEGVCLEPNVKSRESCLTMEETTVKSAYLQANRTESEVLFPSTKIEAKDNLKQVSENDISVEVGVTSSVAASSPFCSISPLVPSSYIGTSSEGEEQKEMVAEKEIKLDRSMSDYAQLEGGNFNQKKSKTEQSQADEKASEKHETGSELFVTKSTCDKSMTGSQLIVAKPKFVDKKQVSAGVCPNDCGCPDCPFLSSKPWLDESQSTPVKEPKTLPPKMLLPGFSCKLPNRGSDLSCTEALDQIRNILCGSKISTRCGDARCSCPAQNRGRPNVTSTAIQKCTCCRDPGAKQRNEESGGFGPSICAAKDNKAMTTVARLGNSCMDKATNYGCKGGNDELLGVETGVSSFFGFLFSEIKNIKDLLNCGLQKVGGMKDCSPCCPGPAPPYMEPPPRCLQPSYCVTRSSCMHAPCCCASPAISIIGVHSVGVKSLLVTWKVDFLGRIVGFEVYMDGYLKSRSFSPTRTSALAYGVDQSVKHTITVVAVMDQMCRSVNVVPVEGSFCYSPTSMAENPSVVVAPRDPPEGRFHLISPRTNPTLE